MPILLECNCPRDLGEGVPDAGVTPTQVCRDANAFSLLWYLFPLGFEIASLQHFNRLSLK